VFGTVSGSTTKLPLRSFRIQDVINSNICVIPESSTELNEFLVKYIPVKHQFPYSTEAYVVVPIDYLSSVDDSGITHMFLFIASSILKERSGSFVAEPETAPNTLSKRPSMFCKVSNCLPTIPGQF
jgi:hypothetical protein